MTDPTNAELADRLRDWAESMVDLPLDAWRRDLRAAADRLHLLDSRGADLARFGCPACDDTDPTPVMTCVRCGATYWAPQDAVARAFGEAVSGE